MFNWFGRKTEAQQTAAPRAEGCGQAQMFDGLSDPALADFLRQGVETSSGAYVSASSALRNMAVLRCMSLISRSIGMLPLNLFERGPDMRKATEHSVYKLLRRQPNAWQTPFAFKSTMQLRALAHGDAYALPVWSGERAVRLFPLASSRMTVEQSDNWDVEYHYTRPDGRKVVFAPKDVFHLRDMSTDGLNGINRVKMAQEAIGLATRAEQAAAKLFKNGMQVGGAIKHPGKLTDAALAHLRESMESKFAGAENAHKWLILEEGMTAEKLAQTSQESQHLENRRMQIEEVARAFDVPRPLLMMDETSWGSGIEQLGIFFVQFALAPWFTAWEEEIWCKLLTERERDNDQYYAKFNERALLRGTLKDQSDYFAKALGAGGQAPWMTQNEVRENVELPESDEEAADSLKNQMSKTSGSQGNEPATTA